MRQQRPGEAAGRLFYESVKDGSAPAWDDLDPEEKRDWCSRTPFGFFVKAYEPRPPRTPETESRPAL